MASICASRGRGKSFFGSAGAMTGVHEIIALDESVPNKNVYIIAPTYDQVKDIYYPILAYEMGAEDLALNSSRDRGRFVFPNNVELRLISFEAIERMRGKGAYLTIGDEVSSWKKGVGAKAAWEGIIQPCVVTRWSKQAAQRYGAVSPGRSINISTPKGYNFFHEMHHYEEVDDQWKSYHYDYRTSPYLDPEEIERIKHTIDPIEFASEYEASFRDSGNSVFYCFDRDVHVTQELMDFVPKEDVHVCIDFNVGIMASSFFGLRGNQMQIIEEMQGHPDTETLATTIKEKYIDNGHKVIAYPDPTGKSRKSSAPVGRTDFSILQKAGIKLRMRKASPKIVDSVAAVNRQLKTAGGEVNFYVHPRCTGTIKSLERTSWTDNNPDLATIDKTEGVEHYSDGIRYGTEMLFPIRNHSNITSRGFGF